MKWRRRLRLWLLGCRAGAAAVANLATGCEQGDAKNQATGGVLPIADCRLPIADCRLPIADCRLPIADCRLPIADCRLPIADCRFYGNGVCGQVILVGLCHVFFLCVMPMASATDKGHYT